MGARQWLTYLVSTFVGLCRQPSRRQPSRRQPPGRQPSGIQFPPEIILLIVDHLDTPSRVLFALTYKKLHSLCFPSNLNLNQRENQELLLLMEIDTTKHYFCHYCTLLHTWRLKYVGLNGWVLLDLLPCNPNRPYSKTFSFPGFFGMDYRFAHLIMNQHFYGPEHGLSPQTFNKSEVSYRDRSICRVTGNYTSTWRIIDNKLLNMRALNIKGKCEGLQRYFRNISLRACYHLASEEKCCKGPPTQLPELKEAQTTPKTFFPCYQSSRSCSVCLTDYCIDVIPSLEGDFNIKLLIYNQLGECRSPYDWNWQSMTFYNVLQEAGPREAFQVEYGAGSIRDRWNGADGIEDRTESTWVEIKDMHPWRKI